MTDKQIPPSLNEFLQKKMQTQNAFNGAQRSLGQALKAYNASNISLQIPKMEELTSSILTFIERRNELLDWSVTTSKLLVDKGVIRNREALRETIQQSVALSVAIPNNLSFATRLKMTDVFITMKKDFESIPNYSQILRKAVGIPFSDLYADILDTFNEDLFSKAFPNSGYSSGATAEPGVEYNNNYEKETHIFDDYVEIDEEEAKVVNTELFEVGTTIINCYNITNIHVNQNFNPTTPQEVETKSTWNSFFAPFIKIVGTVFLTWAMAGDPIEDMNITHTFESIVEHMKEHPVGESDLQIELKEPAKEELNKYDGINSDKTST